MTINTNPLIQADYVPAVQTTGYTSTGMRTIIDKYAAYNSDVVARTLTVNVVGSGVAAGASNVVIVKTLQPGETYTFPEVVGNVLGAGDFVSELASVASKIVRRMSGRQVTT